MFGLTKKGSTDLTHGQLMFRQGDVLIRRLDALPPDGRKRMKRDDQGRIVLAYGEVTGHAHAIYDPGVVAWSLGDKMLLTVTDETALVKHEEHLPIELPAGHYEVVRQRQWTVAQQRKWEYVSD